MTIHDLREEEEIIIKALKEEINPEIRKELEERCLVIEKEKKSLTGINKKD